MIFQVVLGVQSHYPVFPWIVEHATDILNICHVTTDGKSAYERLKETPAVQSGWEGPRRSHDGEMALGNVVGKTISDRRALLWHEKEMAL